MQPAASAIMVYNFAGLAEQYESWMGHPYKLGIISTLEYTMVYLKPPRLELEAKQRRREGNRSVRS